MFTSLLESIPLVGQRKAKEVGKVLTDMGIREKKVGEMSEWKFY